MSTNTRIIIVSAVFAFTIGLGWLWAGDGFPYAFFFFIGYALYMILARQGFGDPAVISLFAFGLYAIMPLLMGGEPIPTYEFDLDPQGATYIYAVASVAIVVGTGLAFWLFPTPAAEAESVTSTGSLYHEAILGTVLSIMLAMIFIAQHGIYIMGGSGESYLDRFADLATPGTGILVLSAPLATAALCFAIVSANRLASPIYLICAVPFLLLFISIGQRKYILLPFLLLAFRFFRIRSLLHLLVVLVAAAFGYVAFNYIGFLREAEIGFGDAFDAHTIALFVDGFQVYMNGEVLSLYMSASAAYGHVLNASFVHDYLGAFLVLLPQFIFGRVTTIDQEFAELLSPDTADLNGAFGFSYFGEAYLVGGAVAIFIATIAITLFLRYIFVSGDGLRFRGMWGVVSLAMTYHAMWYLRLSFIIMLHEVVTQVAVILILHVIVRLSGMRYARTQRALPPP